MDIFGILYEDDDQEIVEFLSHLIVVVDDVVTDHTTHP